MRAAGHREPKAARNDDDLIEKLLPWRWRVALAFPPVRMLLNAGSARVFPGLHAWQNARTRIVDGWLRAELGGDCRPQQLVILGAGFDTRAMRFASLLQGIDVVEVDRSETQALKKARLLGVDGALPAHVRFVPFDLATMRLESLADVGIVPTRRTCFLWEGVSMYLDLDAATSLLSSMGRFAAGSSVLWDFLRQDAQTHPERVRGAPGVLRYVAKQGEPFRCGFDESTLAQTLADHGLTLEDLVGADDVEAALGGPASIWQPGPCCSLYALARARVGL